MWKKSLREDLRRDWVYKRKKKKTKEILKMVLFGVCDLESQMTCRIGVCTLKS